LQVYYNIDIIFYFYIVDAPEEDPQIREGRSNQGSQVTSL